MTFAEQIRAAIQDKQLLQHPFYQDWMSGALTRSQLCNYAHQYTPFVESFPRFVSAVHSHCEDADARRVLLQNLADEEGESQATSHPELWRNFSRALGADETAEFGEQALNAKECFWNLAQSSYAEGLTALYTYEYQIPAIAEAKVQGLQERYDMHSPQALEFFNVHQTADVYHSQACAELLEKIPVAERPQALRAARVAADALWDFLTEAHKAC